MLYLLFRRTQKGKKSELKHREGFIMKLPLLEAEVSVSYARGDVDLNYSYV